MVRLVSSFLVALTLAACAGGGGDDGAVSSADVTVNTTPTKPKKTATTQKKTTGDKPLVPIYVDEDTGQQVAPPTPVGPTGALSIDGAPCTINKLNLDTPVQGNGWTLTVDAHCPTSVSFTASGVNDQAYPQTGTTPFGNVQAAVLSVADESGNDTTVFDTSFGGDSMITAGPVSADRTPVEGSADVVDPLTGGSHFVAYSVSF
jgi:hypothetical protein